MNSNQKSQLSETLSKVIEYSNKSQERLNKWISENEDFFNPKPIIEHSVLESQRLKMDNPFEPINKNLDELNDSSAKTSELMEIMVDLLQASNETNAKMALMIESLSTKQEENNQLTTQFHNEDVNSSKVESRKTLINILIAFATLVATLYGIFS